MNLQFDSDECPICYKSPQVNKAAPPCGHVFCCLCLEKWSTRRNICPACTVEFNHFVYIDDEGDAVVKQVVIPPPNNAEDRPMDQQRQHRIRARVPHIEIRLSLFTICLYFLIHVALVVVGSGIVMVLKMPTSDEYMFIYTVICIIIISCGTRVSLLEHGYILSYKPLVPAVIIGILAMILTIVHFFLLLTETKAK